MGADNLLCRTPGGQVLFNRMTFRVGPGDHTIIMGPSGSGKSSLLRVLAGLWPFEEGRVYRPGVVGSGILFLSQRPYMVEGPLRHQIVYPATPEGVDVTDDELKDLLVRVKLGHLVQERADILDVDRNWAEVLSGGEQQRLAFARLLFHKPRYALMDESTSALDVELEAELMEAAMGAGVTCVSVGHRPTLVRFHKYLLRLDGRGGSSFTPLSPDQLSH